ncbi:MAG: tRNA (adenosine(37)-N6)-threonylcarbamoyltransferase complex ATPase subunit type 1 TsaE [Mogibacterium sp.]|nr:tRNA (adenosine(37)-N6)-threonylcarbamoyltransferase complex ATPase subunit type 1 TsaE [Mogibacterium sp.]
MKEELKRRLSRSPRLVPGDSRGTEDSLTLRLENELETRDLGLELSSCLEVGDVIALVGDLGTGKTTLTRYIAEGLGIKGSVSSPTFTIIKEYHDGRLPLYHFDAYRLGSGDELLDIGGEEYLYGNGVCVVEWADLVTDVLPEESLIIRITYGEKEGERFYQCIF